MEMIFTQLYKKKIACCIVDNRNLCSSGWTREIMINVTDYLIHRFRLFDYDIFIADDEDKLLELVAQDKFYTHALVIASGTSLGLSDRIFSAIEHLCQQDFFIAGHILERNENSYWKNGYYELHHQFYVVRMQDYIDLGKPMVGKQEHVSHIQIQPLRSDECLYNDHEVAAWIQPGNVTKEYDMKCHGWNILSCALEKDKKLIDLGEQIRNNKHYLYYEYDHVFLKQLSKQYQNQFFVNNFYASWNSDSYKNQLPISGPVEQYITVGIGLYWVSYIYKLGFSQNSKVVFTDINYNCLQFMKALVEEWDGENYTDFYKNHLPMIPNGFNGDINSYIEYTDKEWNKFRSSFENWPEIWSNIKKLQYDFILIDYMADYDLSWIEPGKNTVINLSDVFTHSPYTTTQSLKYRISCENKLLNNLKNIDSKIKIMLTSRAADGFHQSQNRIVSGTVDEFDLTDMNDLYRPCWHKDDWNSDRILGI
jgi:hypothetical protein